MNLRIVSRETPVYNRHSQIIKFVSGCVGTIDGITTCVVELDDPAGWWIVPRSTNDEQKLADIGPFNSPEAAVTYMKIVEET